MPFRLVSHSGKSKSVHCLCPTSVPPRAIYPKLPTPTWMPMRPVPSLGEGAGVIGITSCSPARCTVSCSSRPGLSLRGEKASDWR